MTPERFIQATSTFARTNPHGDPGQRSTTRQLTRLEADDSTPEPT